LYLQVFVDGKWININVEITPEYPYGNSQNAFGADFETYSFTFEPVICSGIRIYGKAGGSAGFVGAAELKVIGS